MRLTAHHGRTGKGGKPYSTRHNDRSTPEAKAAVAHPERTKDNVSWSLVKWHDRSRTGVPPFDKGEAFYYEERFTDHLDAQRERYEDARQAARAAKCNPEAYRHNPRTCPEETVIQLGSMKDGSIHPKVLENIVRAYTTWHQETYPQAQILNWALHVDEHTPHVHLRTVWEAHDKDGYLQVSQTKALEEMGVPLPDPGAKPSRRNNRKQTYSASCRQKLMEICHEWGIHPETVPAEPGKRSKDLVQWQAEQEEERLKKALEGLEKVDKAMAQAIKQEHLRSRDEWEWER